MEKIEKAKIEVVAAVIVKGNSVLATQRGYGDFKDGWEFPGGKIENGETPEDALIREIHEELSMTVSVDKYLCTVEHDYPKFHLTMHCYICSILDGELTLCEHEAAKWLDRVHLWDVEWLPADVDVVRALELIN